MPHPTDPNDAEMRHLWDVDHPYYCSTSNYFSAEFKSWGDFVAEEGDSDMDYNLLFRFDWEEGTDHGASEFAGDVNYRNGKLSLFWMGQRKGLFRTTVIEVCRADEPSVIKFLKARWDHLASIWEPISMTRKSEPSK